MRMITPLNPINILLIEDSRGDAVLIKKSLELAMPCAIRISSAASLAAALPLLAEQQFEVALLDRSLPDVDGFSGMHALQSMAPHLPIIFLTAYHDEHIALEAISQGAQDYLFKDKLDGHAVKRAIQYAMLRKQFEGVLRVQANFDMLTGLANRALFESRLDMALARMRRQGGYVSVLFLDVDRFKPVNDTHGHLAGDKLLKQIGTRIKEALRSYDTAARFGGDEFAILLDQLATHDQPLRIAQKICGLFDAPFLIAGHSLTMHASIGIACVDASSNVDGMGLMAQADAAMYEAKSVSETTYRLHGVTAPKRKKQLV